MGVTPQQTDITVKYDCQYIMGDGFEICAIHSGVEEEDVIKAMIVSKKQRLEDVLTYCRERGCQAAAAHLQNAQGDLFTAISNRLQGETTSRVERLFRTVKMRTTNVLPKADHRFEDVHFQQLSPDLTLLGPAEQHAMGKHHGHAAGLLSHGLGHVPVPGEVAGRGWRKPCKGTAAGGVAPNVIPHFSRGNGGLATTQ
jgi:hypothetical protein